MAAELTDAEVFGTAAPPPGALKKELSDADVFGAPPTPTPNDISGEGRDEYGRPLGPLGPAAPAEAGIIPQFLTRTPEPSPPLARTPEISLWPGNAVEAYRETKPILTDRGRELVDQTGPIGQQIINPALDIAGAGVGAFNAGAAALGTYIKETATKYGVPRLGEDINTYLQVAPLAHTALGNPRPPVPGLPGPRVNPMMESFDRAEAMRAEQPSRPQSPDPVVSNIARVQEQIGVRDAPQPPPTGTPADRVPPGVPPGTAVPTILQGQAAIDAVNAQPPASRPGFVPPTAATDTAGRVVPVVAPPDRVAPGAIGPDTVPYGTRAAPLMEGFNRAEPPPTAAAPPPMAEAAPGSVGAAASREGTAPDAISAKTPTQALNDFATSVQQTQLDRSRPGQEPLTSEDHNTYVPGVTRLESARVFNPELSGNHDTLMDIDPSYKAAVDKFEQDNVHDVLKRKYQVMEGDDNSVGALKEQRRDVSPDALGVFKNERAVNAQPVLDAIKEIRDGPNGKIEAVERVLQRVEKQLYDKNGNLETLPSQLYGARKNLTTIRDSKGITQEASDAATARRELGQVQTVLDRVIGEGSNGYSDVYLPRWAHFSRLIDQQQYLQSKTIGGGKVTGQNGNLTWRGIQNLLEQVLKDKRAPGNSRAKSLTEDQLNNLVAIRNELAALKYRDDFAKSNGSPTVKKAAAAARLGSPVMGHVRDAAVHAALVPFAGTHLGSANAIYQFAVKPGLDKRAAARRERKADAIMETTRNRLLNTNVPLE